MRMMLAGLMGLGIATSAVAATPYTEPRHVGSFDGVAASGALDLDVAIAKTASVTLVGDPKAVKNIVTKLEGHTLKLSPKESAGLSGLFAKSAVHATIRLPKLTSLSATGACHLVATGLATGSLQVTVTGASSAKLTGKLQHLNASATGASTVDAIGVSVPDARAMANGASRVSVGVTRKLSAVATGASTVDYAGHPKLTSSASGASSVKAR